MTKSGVKYFKISENLKGRDHSEDLVINGRIILEWLLLSY
jgi:hypothetical protein